MPDTRLHFEDVEIGMRWQTSGVQVTEAHLFAFAGLSGDFYEIHIDDEYARAQGYPGRIAHGLLGLAMADGLKNRAETQAGRHRLARMALALHRAHLHRRPLAG
jgi:3-hydroxybutyryl-CoA dehydratase